MKDKLIPYLLCLIFASPLFSQEFDEKFLKSLPEGVQEDLLSKNKANADAEEIQYKRPSTYIDKPEEYEEEEEEEEDTTLKRYGSEIFSMMQTTLMPVNEPNFDGNYILDFGDVLELQLAGQKSSIEKLLIKRDGSINIPDVGKVFLSGLSLNNAIDVIKNKISSTFIGVDVFITLVNVRDIQIMVAGNVFNPGPYTLNGNSSIFHALSVSGGPSDGGSFREIQLSRNGEIIDTIDLYQTFIYGKNKLNTRLKSGDLIFVKPISALVRVNGGVRRPGIYELKKNENLDLSIFFANGISNLGDKSEISINRVVEGRASTIGIKDINELKDIKPIDGDSVKVRKYPLRSVDISGAVKNPGNYLVNEGEGILSLVSQAGGYTSEAYPFGGVLENKKTLKINQVALDELYKNYIKQLSSIGSAASAGDGSLDIDFLTTTMEDLNESGASGRISAEFDLDKLRRNPELDIVLHEGDKVIIPEYLDQVYIFGEVRNEGTVKFEIGQDYKYYLEKKGGINKYGDNSSIYVLHPNGNTVMVSNKNVFQNQKRNGEIYAGSIIFVPRKVSNSYATTQALQAYATILGNIGISLASLSVLKDD